MDGAQHINPKRKRGTKSQLTLVSPLARRASEAATRRRTGVSLIEIIAAMGLFSVVVLLVAPAISGVAAVRDEAAQHLIAVLELSNLMERIAARDADGTPTQDELNQLAISDAAARELIDPVLTLTIGEPEGTPPMRPLTASLAWRNGAGQYGTPARVTRFLVEREGSP
jgi:type II secretory pathway pseudopilin PulG